MINNFGNRRTDNDLKTVFAYINLNCTHTKDTYDYECLVFAENEKVLLHGKNINAIADKILHHLQHNHKADKIVIKGDFRGVEITLKHIFEPMGVICETISTSSLKQTVSGDTNVKTLNNTDIKQAKKRISDLEVFGDGDKFTPLCKVSSKQEGFMKSTKVCNLPNGCLVQATTQQRNQDGTYAIAEALTFVPNVNMDKETREFIEIK